MILGGMFIKDDPIAKVLDNLMKFDDILACMVARRNMISVEPSGGTNSFKPEVIQIWDEVKRAMEVMFLGISECKNIGKIDFEVYEYNALMYVFPDTDTAIVAIIPSLANKGLVDVELERARKKIQKIREDEEKSK